MTPPPDSALPGPGTPEWDHLLTRYVSGEATDIERSRVDAWAAEAPEHAVELEAWSATWRAGTTEPRGRFDVRAAERSLERRLDTMDAAAQGADAPPVAAAISIARQRRRPRRVGETAIWSVGWRVAGIAAALGVIAVGSLSVRHIGWLMPAQPFREFASPPGSRTTITLRDGTRFVLAPDTRLRVPSDFGATTRTVELTGEASFAVVHDARHPFVVETRRAIVRDVGTVFVVRTYPDDASDRVAVEEGAVSLGLRAARATVTSLRGGDLATIADTAVSVAHGASLVELTAWTQGGLVFKNTPLRDVVRDIGRTYGTDVTVADSVLLARLVTATFTSESLEIVLDGVTRVVGARYERTEHGIVIRRGVVRAGDRVAPAQPTLTTVAQPRGRAN